MLVFTYKMRTWGHRHLDCTNNNLFLLANIRNFNVIMIVIMLYVIVMNVIVINVIAMNVIVMNVIAMNVIVMNVIAINVIVCPMHLNDVK